MSICRIGAYKKIRGEWYRKEKQSPTEVCMGCSLYTLHGGCPLPNTPDKVGISIESGGSECGMSPTSTIWVAATDYTPRDRNRGPRKPRTEKAPKPHVWKPRTMEIGSKATKAVLADLVMESVDEINQLGAENAKLKDQISALRRKQKAAK